MGDETKDILKFMGGCALIGSLAIVGIIWGIVAAFHWALT